MDQQTLDQIEEVPRQIVIGFGKLAQAEQIAMIDHYSRQLDEQSGMKPVYDALISEASPRIVTLDEAAILAAGNPIAQTGINLLREKNDGKRVYQGYMPSLDLVVLPEHDPVMKLAILVSNGLTRTAMLAHESAHKIQYNSSSYSKVTEFLRPYYANGTYHLSPELIMQFADKFLEESDKDPNEASEFIRGMIRPDTQRHAILEVPAHLQSVLYDRTNITFTRGFAQIYGYDHGMISSLVDDVRFLRGLFAAQGMDEPAVEVDINKFVGKHGNTLRIFDKAIEALIRERDVMDVSIAFARGERYYADRAKARSHELGRIQMELIERFK